MDDGVAVLRADAQRNYDRLIHTATTIFEVQGASATLESIAKGAGVGIGTLYRHFPTRRALLEAVYADRVAKLVARVPSLLQKMSPDKALLSWLEMTVDYSLQYGGFSGLLEVASKEKDSPITSAGSQLLTKAQEAGLLRNDVTMVDLLRLINGIVVDIAPEDVKRTNTLVSVIITGLKT
ncbi:MAG TPA: TetR/AcrR family transcriptional regulator [Verrucomicrobiae bacterium]|nr:TetR/AcrR family transcriptional regulator [Verrucomicrobiae bacterium]